MAIDLPYFFSDHNGLNRAARIAAGDIAGNCIPYQDGLLEQEAVCVMAGLDYNTPWTRDTAINTMNAMCIMDPEIAKNTLLSVCEKRNGKNYIGGQYWDCIIWAIGAWQYYLVNADRDFLEFSADAIANTLAHLEQEEFDEKAGLFRGAAVYGDGISAYPDTYARTKEHRTCILDWPDANPQQRSPKGYGIPMKVLSTNCIYFAAYQIAGKMNQQLSKDSSSYIRKAEALKQAINKTLWNEETGRYDYFIDDLQRCNSAEALGLAFSILFGIADDEKAERIFENTFVSEHGIPCLWPSFERYRIAGHYGRHSGTVWPHAQGYWALAMLHQGHWRAFEKELFSLVCKATADKQLAEIYHPISGKIYGGFQEAGSDGIQEWKSCEKQTWSSTAFWSMLFYGVFGLRFNETELQIAPYLPSSMDHMELKNLKLGDATITIIVDRNSDAPESITIPRGLTGTHTYHLSAKAAGNNQ